MKGFLKEDIWSFPSRFFYKAYFCKSERKSLEKGSTGESQLSGSPVSFGSVLQAGGKYSKDNNPLDKRSTEEESTEDSIVSTKETKETTNQAEEVKGVNLTEEKHPSALADNETDVVPSDKRPDPEEDEKEKDIITNLKEKLNSQAQAQDEKGTIGSAQISEEAAPSEGEKNKQTETFDQNSTASNGSDTESKKDKWKSCNFDLDNKISR